MALPISIRTTSVEFSDIDGYMVVIEVFDISRSDLMDADLLEPVDRKWSGQIWDEHICLRERLVDFKWHDSVPFPFQRILRQVLGDESSAVLLPFPMRCIVVRRRKPIEPWRLRERDRLCLRHYQDWRVRSPTMDCTVCLDNSMALVIESVYSVLLPRDSGEVSRLIRCRR